MESIKILENFNEKIKKIKYEERKERFITLARAEEIVSKYMEEKNKVGGTNFEVSKKKIENFEKTIFEVLEYNILEKNQILNIDPNYLSQLENYYCQLYYFYIKTDLFTNLKKVYKNNKMNYVNECIEDVVKSLKEGYLGEMNEFFRIMETTEDEINLIYSLFGEMTMQMYSDMKRLDSKLLKIVRENKNNTSLQFIECLKEEILPLEKSNNERNELASKVDLSKKDLVFSILFLLKFAIFKATNLIALEEQEKNLEENMKGILKIDVKEKSISGIIKNIRKDSLDLEISAEINRVQKIVREHYDGFKADEHIGFENMFLNKENALKNFIILLTVKEENSELDSKIQALIKRVARKDEVKDHEYAYLINKFNFRAWLELLDDEKKIEEFFSLKLKYERELNEHINHLILEKIELLGNVNI